MRFGRRWVAAALCAATIVPLAACGKTPPREEGLSWTVSGPDVSRWQHPNGACIDWDQVAAGDPDSGTPPRQFALIKATEGATYVNPYFGACGGSAERGDWNAVGAAGMARGAYHFARPSLPLSDAVAEAKFFVATIGAQNVAGTLPPVLDIEDAGGLTPPQLITWTQLWLDTVRKATGRVPVIYTYPNFWATRFGGSTAFAAYPLWIADYRDPTVGPRLPLQGQWPAWTMWQYTSSETQPGIRGRIDMNWFAGDELALAAFADGSVPPSWPITAPAPPLAIKAVAGNGSATVSWTPASNGGEAVTSYTVTASNGASRRVKGTSTSAVVTGLTNGAPHTFTVTATNSAGTSAPSRTSAAVRPRVPTHMESRLTRTTVPYGDETTMQATITRTDTGAALVDQPVTVWQRPVGTTTWTQIGTTQTNTAGTASWSLQPVASLDMRMLWRPPAEFEPQTSVTHTVRVTDVPTIVSAAGNRSVVTVGTPVVVSATLKRADTNAPIARAAIAVSTRAAGSDTWATAGSVTTDVAGVARWSFAPTVNTDVRLSYAAPARWRSATALTTALVRPSVRTRLSAPTARPAKAVRLTGSVRGGVAGAVVERQRYVNGAWKTVASQRLSSALTYDFVVRHRVAGTYTFRVLAPATATLSAAAGKTVRLTVR